MCVCVCVCSNSQVILASQKRSSLWVASSSPLGDSEILKCKRLVAMVISLISFFCSRPPSPYSKLSWRVPPNLQSQFCRCWGLVCVCDCYVRRKQRLSLEPLVAALLLSISKCLRGLLDAILGVTSNERGDMGVSLADPSAFSGSVLRLLSSCLFPPPLMQMEELVGERHPDSGDDRLFLHHHLFRTHGVDDDCKFSLPAAHSLFFCSRRPENSLQFRKSFLPSRRQTLVAGGGFKLS